MFTSYEFIFFLVGLLFVYYLVPKKVQWILLLFVNFSCHQVYKVASIAGQHDDTMQSV